MHRRYGLLILLTAIIVLTAAYLSVMAFNVSGLPLAVQVVDAHRGVIVPVPGLPLPKGMHAGQHIDLTEQPAATRIAIAQLHSSGQLLPQGRVYTFTIRRGLARIPIPVRSISWEAAPDLGLIAWLRIFEGLFSGAIALAALWRGRDRAAAGLALFATAFLVALAATTTPLQGTAGLAGLLSAWVLFLLARVGLFGMAESMAGAALDPRARSWWRAGFLLLLGAGAVISLGGPLIYVTARWPELLHPRYGFVMTASYLIPVLLLFVSYHKAAAAQRLRLRWMLWSGSMFVVGIALSNTQILEPTETRAATACAVASALAGFLYAILRHRVVDLRVVFSRTLVYAMTTSLVLGVLALLESLIERAALGNGTSLALELAVPLGLGVSLSTVHRRIDDTVDGLIFRRQYREAMALRRFAGESAFVTQPDTLLDLTVDQLQLHVGAPWVAFYEYTPEGYTRVRQRGEQDLPQSVSTDDLALVRLRAHDSEVDLHEAPSGLGADGYAFPLRARGHLLGALVVGPRPGEHYAIEERELIAHVAHAVGASLFALRAQVTEEQLISARAQIDASTVRLDQARAQVRASEALLNDARMRESTLLDALRTLGATPRA
ncbi:MAG TPA: GAF domain-containing protein [Steroidobacteraceae bacterium]|nr:GAF domain-containing protein [Steroidobacteraceae bacterium]